MVFCDYINARFLKIDLEKHFKKYYLFIHERHTERGRDIGRRRSRFLAENLMWDLIPGPRIMP